MAGVVVTMAALCAGSVPLARAQPSPSPSPSATADAETEACFAAAEQAQPLIRQRKFREARADLETCARDRCPLVARTDCREWLTQVSARQPSVVVVGHIARGDETRVVRGIRATVDGGIVIDRADAVPFAVDPGQHHLRLERAGAPPIEEEIYVAEGEKDRVIDALWREAPLAAPHPPEGEPSRPVPASVYVLGALGVVGLGVGAYLEYAGLSKRSQLDSQCKPTRSCVPSDVDSALQITRAGDLTLAGGGAFALGAVILYLTRPVVDAPPKEESVGWLIAPAPGGLVAAVRGRL